MDTLAAMTTRYRHVRRPAGASGADCGPDCPLLGRVCVRVEPGDGEVSGIAGAVKVRFDHEREDRWVGEDQLEVVR